ncbi:MAG: class I SAM-dependent methyltransferase [Sandaracinaceae bacterium]|nr:class I SAM-dependent methyltransferase [Sandaracinaceae bacterium]
MSSFETLIASLVRSLGGDPPPAAVATFLTELARWGAKLRLTGAREPAALTEVALADAVILADENVIPRGVHFVDVGAGAGAPSLPLVLLRPDLRATLIEPLQKRVSFLRTMIGTLELQDRVVVRAERVQAVHERFDLALSRATFAPAEWFPIGSALAPEVLVMTAGPAWDGADRVAERRYELPFSHAPRWVGRFRSATGGAAEPR